MVISIEEFQVEVLKDALTKHSSTFGKNSRKKNWELHSYVIVWRARRFGLPIKRFQITSIHFRKYYSLRLISLAYFISITVPLENTITLLYRYKRLLPLHKYLLNALFISK